MLLFIGLTLGSRLIFDILFVFEMLSRSYFVFMLFELLPLGGAVLISTSTSTSLEKLKGWTWI